MAELEFEIVDWLGASMEDPLERETLSSLRITVGPNRIPVTEVEDTIAQTVRRHINVPAYLVARWLVVNWWRLRWEPYRSNPSLDWRYSHSMAAIGGDYVWPALIFASDGERIQLRLQAEMSPDVSALRYLRNINIDVSAVDFERAVERFLDTVEARVTTRLPGERELSELRDELNQERRDPRQAIDCKLQALAGFDPGSAPDEWMAVARDLAAQAGMAAAEEILAVVPLLQRGITAAQEAVSAMRQSTTTVKLDFAAPQQKQSPVGEPPWRRGARLASELRIMMGITSGPVQNSDLEQLLDAKLPLPWTQWSGSKALSGGYRNGVNHGRTALLVTTPREENQRFYLARVIGATLSASADQHVLPISSAETASQRFNRSFAQELLCPWRELDAFTDQNGTDDDGIADAAAHFAVSQWVVLTTLVNKGKIPRYRMPIPGVGNYATAA
jgi:hypothetical protein